MLRMVRVVIHIMLWMYDVVHAMLYVIDYSTSAYVIVGYSNSTCCVITCLCYMHARSFVMHVVVSLSYVTRVQRTLSYVLCYHLPMLHACKELCHDCVCGCV